MSAESSIRFRMRRRPPAVSPRSGTEDPGGSHQAIRFRKTLPPQIERDRASPPEMHRRRDPRKAEMDGSLFRPQSKSSDARSGFSGPHRRSFRTRPRPGRAGPGANGLSKRNSRRQGPKQSMIVARDLQRNRCSERATETALRTQQADQNSQTLPANALLFASDACSFFSNGA